jgi:hypothetical protein
VPRERDVRRDRRTRSGQLQQYSTCSAGGAALCSGGHRTVESHERSSAPPTVIDRCSKASALWRGRRGCGGGSGRSQVRSRGSAGRRSACGRGGWGQLRSGGRAGRDDRSRGRRERSGLIAGYGSRRIRRRGRGLRRRPSMVDCRDGCGRCGRTRHACVGLGQTVPFVVMPGTVGGGGIVEIASVGGGGATAKRRHARDQNSRTKGREEFHPARPAKYRSAVNCGRSSNVELGRIWPILSAGHLLWPSQ